MLVSEIGADCGAQPERAISNTATRCDADLVIFISTILCVHPSLIVETRHKRQMFLVLD